MQEESLYERIGGDEALRQLTDCFYDLVFEHELISRLFKSDKELIKTKQRLFLTQFLGGPELYSDVYGHPRMRARHLPHTITEDDAIAWLQCMSQAVGSLPISKDLKDELFNRFPRTAFFMVNS
ncbi:globin domain-containing protein [Dyadobacter sandarakinus]|uniref:Globin n=1 Tax=Dyadobacter sandarakinus TaxID=2747268 RepID=A0ABX7I783_9BACT|nr:globin [Dyadobacter sandarakinus]QRR01038.1 globin [Dyadobacter sandarakinus]